MPRVVVLGAGIGGVPMAFELREKLGRKAEIDVVSESEWFQFAPSNPWVAVSWRKPEDVKVHLPPVFARLGIGFHACGAKQVHPEKSEVLLNDGRTVMVQPYATSVDADGETALIYIDGAFSHAIRKGPLLRVTGAVTDQLWAEEDITPREAAADERSVAEDTLDALPWAREELLYARVDLVRDAGGAPRLLELELAEPSLFLRLGAGAASRLAHAIAARLGE